MTRARKKWYNHYLVVITPRRGCDDYCLIHHRIKIEVISPYVLNSPGGGRETVDNRCVSHLKMCAHCPMTYSNA